MDLGKIDPRFFQDGSVGQHAAGTAAAAGAFPAILLEASAIKGLKGFADGALELAGEIAAALSQGLGLRGCT